jgi:hypothetical protein
VSEIEKRKDSFYKTEDGASKNFLSSPDKSKTPTNPTPVGPINGSEHKSNKEVYKALRGNNPY